MRKFRLLFFCVAAAGCCWAQYGGQRCCSSMLTPSQLDRWDIEHPSGSPATPPSGESVSVVRLRHKPPAKARDAFLRGIRFDDAGDFEHAAAEFAQAISLDPQFSEAYGNLGVEYSAVGRYDQAIAQFHRALTLDPATSFHHSNLAFSLIRINRLQEAETEAQAALGLDSTNSSAHFLLGCLWATRPEKRSAAETHLSYAARTMPAAHLALAQLYAAEGSAQIARAELEHYLEASAPGKEIQVNRGQSFLSTR